MSSKPIVINFPSANVEQAARFYAHFLGVEFARSPTAENSYHAPINDEGLLITISQRHSADEPVTCYFAVDDLAAAIQEVEQAGGRVRVQPFQLTIAPTARTEFKAEVEKDYGFAASAMGDELGRACEVTDSDGNIFGLIELAHFARPLFKVGQYANPLSRAQIRAHESAKRRGAIP